MNNTSTPIFRTILLGFVLPLFVAPLRMTAQCDPVSLLPCADLAVTVPLRFDFAGNEGGLDDASGNEVGFTLVDNHGEARMPADGTPTYPNVNGYEPGKLSVSNGNLILTAGQGIAFRKPGGSTNNNNQINTLGVGVRDWSANTLNVETKLLSLATGGNSAQAGIWFGTDEDNFVKLAAANDNQIELRIEQDGVSNNNLATTLRVEGLNLANQDITLRLSVDPVAATISGYYRIGSGPEVQVIQSSTASLALPNGFITGRVFGSEAAMTLAGVFATYRNGSVFDATFDYFAITPETGTGVPGCPPLSPLPCDEVAVTLPFTLPFSGTETGVANTGFTMVDPPSVNLFPATPSNPDVPGLEAGLLDITGGKLLITSTKGINYELPPASSENNSQVNALGVGFAAPGRVFDISVDLDQPDFAGSSGNHSQQGGIWFGLDEDNYAKLVVGKTGSSTQRVQLLVEHIDPTDNTNVLVEEINQTGLPQTATTIQLRLEVDPANLTVSGYYTVDGGAEVKVSEGGLDAASFPVSFLTGLDHDTDPATEALTFAGLFTTHRKAAATEAIAFGFDNFAIVPNVVTPSLSFSPRQIDVRIREGETIPAQVATLSASDGGSPAVTLSDDPDAAAWLVLPTAPAVGQMFFEVEPDLPPDEYRTTVFVSAAGYTTTQLDITVTVAANQAVISPSSTEVVLDATVGGAGRDSTILLANTGNTALGNPTAVLTGPDAAMFSVNSADLPASIPASGSAPLTVTFAPSGEGPARATLTLSGGGADPVAISLDGLGKDGSGGTDEPSLQYIFDTYGLPIAVGDQDVSTNLIELPAGAGYNDLLGDEVVAPRFTRAGGDPVTVELLSVFGPEGNDPVVALGWYESGLPTSATELFTVSNSPAGNGQTLNPILSGTTSFDPGNATFGLYSRWPFFSDRRIYSEDELNTFSGSIPHHVRVYPLPGEDDAYVVATEEHISGYDYQDIVIVVRNVAPAPDPSEVLRINFSDDGTPAPTGYLRDHGQAYANRGTETYGWVVPGTSTPLSLVGNGRNRTPDPDQNTLTETLMHMLYGDTGGSNGVSAPGAWEVAVANGDYRVTVRAGDEDAEGTSGTRHLINVEGNKLIDELAQQGSANHFTGTGVVTVADGRLTIDADGGFNTKITSVVIEPTTSSPQAYFSDPNPANGATGVAVSGFQIAVTVNTSAGYELDKNSLAGNVKLFEQTAQGPVEVAANFNDTGGGDAVILTPTAALKPGTTYLFQLSGVEANRIGNLSDRITFADFTSTFTTAAEGDTNPPADLTGVSFTQVRGAALGQGVADRFSSLVIGPDGKLYASTTGEIIKRWTIESDGTLSNLEELSVNLTGANHPVTGDPLGNDRLIIGFTFAPEATASNLIAYVSHSAATLTAGPEWDGMVSRLSGPNLSNVEDILIHLPRSTKDHLTNSIVVGEDDDLYIVQGSNTAGGAPDGSWGFRSERLLAAAVLRLEVDKLPTQLPLSVHTTDDFAVINTAPATGLLMSDGTYNPYSADAPLTLYATGIRNAYDMVFHSNGWLYVPTNGTAGNNNSSPITPASADYVNRDPSGKGVRRPNGTFFVDPTIPGVVGGETQKDWLFKSRGGSYHGHPNPYRGEFVLNHGGRPYSGLPGQSAGSHTDVQKYPDDLGPDPNYREVAYDFAFNKSPNGAIEYRSNAFGGKLRGMLMVVRFSGQDDIIVMQPGNNSGDIIAAFEDVPGLQGYDDPLDVVEDPRTGNLYLAQYDRTGGAFQLILMQADVPAQPEAVIAATPDELIFETTVSTDGEQTDEQTVTITNEGTVALDITDVTLTGPYADQFQFTGPSVTNIAPASAQTYTVTYAPTLTTTDLGYQEAALSFTSNGNQGELFTVGLHGLKKAGYQSTNEPPLQDVVDALGIGIDVGWSTLTGPTTAAPIGAEVLVPLFEAAGPGDVVITPVARYSPAELLPFGWYTNSGTGPSLNEVGQLLSGPDAAQTLNPGLAAGQDAFDPQGAPFGVYLSSAVFGRTYYTEDGLNTGPVAHRARVYPAKDRGGNLLPDSYLIAFEDASNGDYQDYVFVLTNAKPYEPAAQVLTFSPDALTYRVQLGMQSPTQASVLSASVSLNPAQLTLSASESWVDLPTSINLDTPLDFSVDATNLTVGSYQATVTAEAPGFAPATLNLTATVTEDLAYYARINFQDGTFTPPAGYTADTGEAYGSRGNGLEFGWIAEGSGAPLDNTDQARGEARGVDDTSSDAEKLLRSHLMLDKTNLSPRQPAHWEIALPNGRYLVEVAAGDPSFYNSVHTLRAEGVTLIDGFVPSASDWYRSGADTVEVEDGKLTIDDTGAPVDANVKIIYADITRVGDIVIAPTVVAELSGTLNRDGDYLDSVVVALATTDPSGSGIQSVRYRIDGGAYQAYSEPFVLKLDGAQTADYVLDLEVTDNDGATGTNRTEFTVAQSTGAILRLENMTKLPAGDRSFPAPDYFTFHRVASVVNRQGEVLLVKDTNIVRIHNDGTQPLIIDDLATSDADDFTVEGLTIPPGGLTVQPGSFVDVTLRFVTSTGSSAKLVKESLLLTTNADNFAAETAVLHGAYMNREEGGNELDILQIWRAYGFTTELGKKSNGQPETRPGSARPTDEQVSNGSQGDLILPGFFEQADTTKPVQMVYLAAFHGPGDARLELVKADSSTAGEIFFNHHPMAYQTFLPRINGTEHRIAGAWSERIRDTFQIEAANLYYSTGSPDNLLGIRIYRVRDQDGNVVPNEYLITQDYIGGGCGPGSANCDWNDNMGYLTNVRPVAKPTAGTLSDVVAEANVPLTFGVDTAFTVGYPGNHLSYSASQMDGSPLPDWVGLDGQTGTFSIDAPRHANERTYNIMVTASDFNEVSTSADFDLTVLASGALPIELLAFAAEAEVDGISLHWVTAYETDNDYFELQRATDGNQFRPIATVTGAGTSTDRQYYDYHDADPEPGTNYYRLKQVDYDGSFTYSKVVSVEFAGEDELAITVYPNPTQGAVTLEFSEPVDAGRASLYDASGRRIRNWTLPEGGRRMPLDISDLQAGTWFLRVTTGDTTHVLRLLRQ
jgi:hypothetical protein